MSLDLVRSYDFGGKGIIPIFVARLIFINVHRRGVPLSTAHKLVNGHAYKFP